MDNKITLEELAPYLPYGLKIKCTIDNSVGSMFSISGHQYICKGLFDLKNGTDKREFIGIDFNNYTNLASPKNFIPLVRPLSQLTQEIEHNGERLVPIVELAKIAEKDHFCNDELIYKDQEETSGVGWAENEIRYVFIYSKKQRGFYLESNPYQKLIIANQDILHRKLNEWHFDCNNWLERGLALPIVD